MSSSISSLPALSLADRLANLQSALTSALPPADMPTSLATDLAGGDSAGRSNGDQNYSPPLAATATANQAAVLRLLQDPAEAAAATAQLRQLLLAQPRTALQAQASVSAAQTLALLASA